MAKTVRIRDKERTKQKLIDAVGKILVKEGYKEIGINKVAQVAKVNKRLIYEYFNGINGLIKAYLQDVDFWAIEKSKSENSQIPDFLDKEVVFNILKSDFEYFKDSAQMQKIIIWSISEKNKTIRNLTEEREEYGKKLFKLADKDFDITDIDFRALNAIFVSSIYYMILHTKTNGTTICEIDVSTEEGEQRIFKTIHQILDWVYSSFKK